MDFLARQTRARRRSRLLTAAFLLATLTIGLAVQLGMYPLVSAVMPIRSLTQWWQHPLCWVLGGGIALTILGGALWRGWQLRHGGAALAQLLSARPITGTGGDAAERRLSNVVEEMAIAAGLPMPSLYVLDQEPAINAMVAGLRPGDTAVLVTRGALERLSREELQGVIAHEFSHILNGDVRLNVRLIALISGIYGLTTLGQWCARAATRTAPGRQDSPIARAALLAVSLVLMACGALGRLLGQLIQAAISRQRELLADAGAVQFTRLPDGLARALIRIRHEGSDLRSLHAAHVSHMCFGASLAGGRHGWLDTHPSVEQRLAALGHKWVVIGRRPPPDAVPAATVPPPFSAAAVTGVGPDTSVLPAAVPSPLPAATPAAARAVTPDHLEQARRWLARLPDDLHRALHQPEQAPHAITALILAWSPKLDPHRPTPGSPGIPLEAWRTALRELGPRFRLPVLDLALPALRALPSAQRQEWLARWQRLCQADRILTRFESVLMLILTRQLSPPHPLRDRVRHHRYDQVGAALQQLFSTLIWAGKMRGQRAAALYRQHTAGLLSARYPLLSARECTQAAFAGSMRQLVALHPLLRQGLMDHCTDLVLADRRVTLMEYELLRAVGALLECPLPPRIMDEDQAVR